MQNKNLINESEISEALEAVSRDGTNINLPRFMHLQGNKRVVLAAMKENLSACRYSLLGYEETKALVYKQFT